MSPTRRTFLAGLSVMAVAGLLSACGDDTAPSTSATDASSAAEESAFPATIKHKYGETEVTAAPTRVVSVGPDRPGRPAGTRDRAGRGHQVVRRRPRLHLPVGDRRARRRGAPRGARGHQRHPDREDRGARPGPDRRPVLRHDREGVRAALASSPRRWRSPATTPTTARRGTRRRCGSGPRSGSPSRCRPSSTTSRRRSPRPRPTTRSSRGSSAAVITPYEGLFVYGPEDPRSRMLVDLGFTFPEILAGRRRRVRRLHQRGADRGPRGGRRRGLARPRGRPAVKDVFDKTTTAEEGRWFDISDANGAYYVAHSFVTPLSIPYVLERYVPQLAAAVDGDPDTVPPVVND